MEVIKHRILSQGDLEKSSGGIYNPGCVSDGDIRILLPRVEKDYYFTNDVRPVLIKGTLEELKKGQYVSTDLKIVGYPADCRCEDFRLWKHKGELYATHTMVLGWSGSSNSEPKLITVVIAKVVDNELRLFDYLSVPLKRKHVEKNWQLFSYNDNVYCIYSLDPLIIFKHIGFSWHCIKEEENGLQAMVNSKLIGSGHLSLSAMVHLRDEFMLGFWHSYVGGIMHQGAFILNMKSMDITEFTEPILNGEGWKDGYKPGIPYISGLVVTDTTVEAWLGECDSHTSLIEFPKQELIDILVNSPFKKQTPLKVMFADLGLGDYLCAMYAIQGWLNDNPDNYVVLFAKYSHHMELASVLRMPRVKIFQHSDQKTVVDLTSNVDEKEYKEKIRYSFKNWYGYKLKTKPAIPEIQNIKELPEYKDCIVLFPFCHGEIREWDVKYWILLSEMLFQKGFHVVIADQHEMRCKKITGEFYGNKSLMDIFKLVKSAALVITNESLGSHLAGLLDTKCITLSGWLNPEVVNDMTNNDFIYNQTTHNPARNLNLITCDDVIAKMEQMNIKPIKHESI